jgi:hypothetical protein
MNEKKAKALRKKIYGDQSLKERRKYRQEVDGNLTVLGLRKEYQEAKKALR